MKNILIIIISILSCLSALTTNAQNKTLGSNSITIKDSSNLRNVNINQGNGIQNITYLGITKLQLDSLINALKKSENGSLESSQFSNEKLDSIKIALNTFIAKLSEKEKENNSYSYQDSLLRLKRQQIEYLSQIYEMKRQSDIQLAQIKSISEAKKNPCEIKHTGDLLIVNKLNKQFEITLEIYSNGNYEKRKLDLSALESDNFYDLPLNAERIICQINETGVGHSTCDSCPGGPIHKTKEIRLVECNSVKVEIK